MNSDSTRYRGAGMRLGCWLHGWLQAVQKRHDLSLASDIGGHAILTARVVKHLNECSCFAFVFQTFFLSLFPAP